MSKHAIDESILKVSIDQAVNKRFIERHPKEEVQKEIKKAEIVEKVVSEIKSECTDSASFYKKLLEVANALECVASEYQSQYFVKGKIYSGEFED